MPGQRLKAICDAASAVSFSLLRKNAICAAVSDIKVGPLGLHWVMLTLFKECLYLISVLTGRRSIACCFMSCLADPRVNRQSLSSNAITSPIGCFCSSAVVMRATSGPAHEFMYLCLSRPARCARESDELRHMVRKFVKLRKTDAFAAMVHWRSASWHRRPNEKTRIAGVHRAYAAL